MSTTPAKYDDASRKDLARKAARGGGITLVGNAAASILNGLGFIVLARLLSPAEFGVVALVASVVAILAVFKDLGLSAAAVQSSDISQNEVTALYWVNVGASLALGAVTIALGPVLAWFYGNDHVLLVTVVVGLTFPLGGMSAQYIAMLQRAFDFRSLAIVKLLSAGCGVAGGIALAQAGGGYWALVFRLLVAELATLSAAVYLSSWRPSVPYWGRSTMALLRFGGNISLFGILNKVVMQLDNVLIGWMWGGAHLAQYDRAYQLMMGPTTQLQMPLSKVITASLSRLQHRPAEYRRFYVNSLLSILILSVPIAGYMLLFADSLIVAILGPQWQQAALLLQCLGGTMLLRPLFNSMGWIYLSQGRGRDLRNWGFVTSAIMVSAYIAGLPFGAKGVAIAHSCAAIVLIAPALKFAFRKSKITLLDIIKVGAPVYGVVLASMAISATLKIVLFAESRDIVLPLMAGTMAYGLVLTAAILINHQLRSIAVQLGVKAMEHLKRRFRFPVDGSRP